jgi:hypothetical protein
MIVDYLLVKNLQEVIQQVSHRNSFLITLQSNCQKVLDNLCRYLQEGCPINPISRLKGFSFLFSFRAVGYCGEKIFFFEDSKINGEIL